jgi:hypothetical protein
MLSALFRRVKRNTAPYLAHCSESLLRQATEDAALLHLPVMKEVQHVLCHIVSHSAQACRQLASNDPLRIHIESIANEADRAVIMTRQIMTASPTYDNDASQA